MTEHNAYNDFLPMPAISQHAINFTPSCSTKQGLNVALGAESQLKEVGKTHWMVGFLENRQPTCWANLALVRVNYDFPSGTYCDRDHTSEASRAGGRWKSQILGQPSFCLPAPRTSTWYTMRSTSQIGGSAAQKLDQASSGLREPRISTRYTIRLRHL